MKKIKIDIMENLLETELLSISGGQNLLGPTFWWLYVFTEVMEGVQKGVVTDCSETCTN
ncbi:hypothetical protein LV84_00336 [Algoriphagus ratkowskyi]|uniref:Uncharacterized protein n=1 Tax=Algoriphagus ratkowskyi TaxID=57028 RepID=A0A2W7RKK2_9BACT|nr:hypothetical protein [Algoriphagus ratkowskyi]PZX61348.1 hypothetical protein LV84_00336 [Algoriphagus ratkowskyi]